MWLETGEFGMLGTVGGGAASGLEGYENAAPMEIAGVETAFYRDIRYVFHYVRSF